MVVFPCHTFISLRLLSICWFVPNRLPGLEDAAALCLYILRSFLPHSPPQWMCVTREDGLFVTLSCHWINSCQTDSIWFNANTEKKANLHFSDDWEGKICDEVKVESVVLLRILHHVATRTAGWDRDSVAKKCVFACIWLEEGCWRSHGTADSQFLLRPYGLKSAPIHTHAVCSPSLKPYSVEPYTTTTKVTLT